MRGGGGVEESLIRGQGERKTEGRANGGPDPIGLLFGSRNAVDCKQVDTRNRTDGGRGE